MNFYRRNTFRDWCADVGFIYLIAVGFVLLTFVLLQADIPVFEPLEPPSFPGPPAP